MVFAKILRMVSIFLVMCFLLQLDHAIAKKSDHHHHHNKKSKHHPKKEKGKISFFDIVSFTSQPIVISPDADELDDTGLFKTVFQIEKTGDDKHHHHEDENDDGDTGDENDKAWKIWHFTAAFGQTFGGFDLLQQKIFIPQSLIKNNHSSIIVDFTEYINGICQLSLPLLTDDQCIDIGAAIDSVKSELQSQGFMAVGKNLPGIKESWLGE